MDLQTLKNAYTQEHAYKDWKELQEYHKYNPRGIEEHMNEICIRAQKAALEKAAKSAKIKITWETGKTYIVDTAGYDDQVFTVDRTSITNEQNLIR